MPGSRVVRAWLAAAAGACLLAGGLVAPAAADTPPVVVDFDQPAAGTTVTGQYAASGVVFGAPPGGSDGLHPVATAVPSGIARSGGQVGDISVCPGCEFSSARTTGSFTVPQRSVTVYVGLLGAVTPSCTGDADPACARVTLRVFDAAGAVVGTAGPVQVRRGAPVGEPLTVTASGDVIGGFEIAARSDTDIGKQVAIDDLTFSRTSALPPVTPPVPPSTIEPGPPSCGPVTTRDQLVAALSTPSCTTVEVADTAQIDLSGTEMEEGSAIVVPDGVTLRGNRSPTSKGGLLFMSRRVTGTDEKFRMVLLGDGSRVTGLRLRGYNPSDTKWRHDLTSAVRVRDYASSALIDNNEIWGWPLAAVQVQRVQTTKETADRIRVTGNFLHHNVQCGRGYGVVFFSGGYALVDRNVFDLNRHDVAGDGTPESGYLARTNLVLSRGRTCPSKFVGSYYNQHFDMHGRGAQGQGGGYGGVAGQYLEIVGNTIRGAQEYGLYNTRPAFWLRGTPAERAVFSGNVVVHEDEGDAVRVSDAGDLKKDGTLVVRGNRYGVDTSLELATGDFDGDGRQDVFQAAGAVWAYAPGGAREWHVLRGSRTRLKDLLLADVDGDGRTDAVTRTGTSWRVSSGASDDWRPLAAPGSSAPVPSYRLADLDGDGRADLFRADGDHFLVSWAAASPWERLAASSFTTARLRFGDFDGDGRADVFSLANGQWSVSYGGRTSWQRLNARLSSDLSRLVLADMDGDGRTDVLRASGRDWQVSWSGSTPFRTLQRKALPAGQAALGLAVTLSADFTGDGRADILRFAGIGLGVRPLQWFELSDAGTGRLTRWSAQNMI